MAGVVTEGLPGRARADDRGVWLPHGMAGIRRSLYLVDLTLTCPADRHVLARFRRLDADSVPEPPGRVHLPRSEATNPWSDGRGYELKQADSGASASLDSPATPNRQAAGLRSAT